MLQDRLEPQETLVLLVRLVQQDQREIQVQQGLLAPLELIL